MTNSQEYTLHVLNELMVASCAAMSLRADAGRDAADLPNLELAERLKAEIAAIHGRAADNNSIVAAAFAAMSVNVSGAVDSVEMALQRRIDSALADNRLPVGLREGLARFSDAARRYSSKLM